MMKFESYVIDFVTLRRDDVVVTKNYISCINEQFKCVDISYSQKI